jgi:hypothetical protein
VVRKQQSSSLYGCSGSSLVLVITNWTRVLEWVGSSAATAAVELGLCDQDGEGLHHLLVTGPFCTAVM